ncbi:DUF1508 domain-containing protein [Candidatus Dojkabacteria bacterium]|nr:DUF1508 domain-containing protein [Candidatus Dojkabacteria bacterium]
MEKYKFIIGLNKEGKYYLALMTKEERLVFVTEPHEKKQDAITAIGVLKKYSAGAEVYDLTGEE